MAVSPSRFAAEREPSPTSILTQRCLLAGATLAYLPFNFFCWLSPIVTIVFGVMGWTDRR